VYNTGVVVTYKRVHAILDEITAICGQEKHSEDKILRHNNNTVTQKCAPMMSST
jgi:hypothetical protein